MIIVCDSIVEIGLTEEITGLCSALTKPAFVKTMSIAKHRIAIINPAPKALFMPDPHAYEGILSDKTVFVKVY
jgi:hypothetical protein